MHNLLLASETGHTHLRRLFLLRNVAVLAQLLTLFLLYRFMSEDFRWTPMLGTVLLLVLVNLATGWRLARNDPVSHSELFLQLTLDVGALTVLLYFGGGSTNPFVSLYLLPLVLAAVILPRRYTWGMAALTIACYSLLMRWYVPLPVRNAHARHGTDGAYAPLPPPDDAFNVHVLGMWLGFVISAGVIAYFAVEMAAAVRRRDAELSRAREETLRNERIVALGTLAAGAAHEMGTPLSTMAVLVGEMRGECRTPEQHHNLALLDEQIKHCKRILDQLISQAQQTPDEMNAEQFLHGVLDEWQLLRPAAQYRYRVEGDAPAPLLRTDPALRAALLNLLNNAADASPEGMEVVLIKRAGSAVLEIRDCGPGLDREAARRAGSAFFTTKQEGRGLGLFLANATLERLGGSVRLFNRKEGGATTEVILPCHKENA